MSVIQESDSASPLASREASGPASARERSREATRERLISAGLSLFSDRGLHGVTTHDIARGAGVATGTFYLHFTDKRELFREIAGQAVHHLLARLDRCAHLEDLPSLVAAQSEALVDFATENREVIGMLFSADSDAAAVEADILNQLAERIAEDRRQAVASGKGSPGLDPLVAGHAVVGMWSRVLAWWSEDPSRVSREALIETLTRIQLTGTNPA